MEKKGFVYILASKYRGTIYIGVTSDLQRRVAAHKAFLIKGFSSKYKTTDLVYFEQYDFVSMAIYREKQLKKWKRSWKIELIEERNPLWKDLCSLKY